MIAFSFWLICIIQTPKREVSIWEKMNLPLEIFDDLENKTIILAGDFKLFLDSTLKAEGGSLF